jgi:hypothetical protein
VGKWFESLLKVSIVFKDSHWFFPKIVLCVLLALLAAIVLVHGVPFLRDIRDGKRKVSFSIKPFDMLRFSGTILLTILYFVSMDYVGDFFPNMGLGFLFMSIPFMFVLSLLYVHALDRRKLLAMGMNAVISPVAAWYILARLFNISLP